MAEEYAVRGDSADVPPRSVLLEVSEHRDELDALLIEGILEVLVLLPLTPGIVAAGVLPRGEGRGVGGDTVRYTESLDAIYRRSNRDSTLNDPYASLASSSFCAHPNDPNCELLRGEDGHVPYCSGGVEAGREHHRGRDLIGDWGEEEILPGDGVASTKSYHVEAR